MVKFKYDDLRAKVSKKEWPGEVLQCFGCCERGEPKDVKVGAWATPGV